MTGVIRDGFQEVGEEGTAMQSSSVRVGPPPPTDSFIPKTVLLAE